jgi:hypothetical protein
VQLRTSVIGVIFVMVFSACQQANEPANEQSNIQQTKQPANPKEIAAAQRHYLEVISDSGIDFQHSNQMQGQYLAHEILGAGAGVFDADGDGDLDVYFRQGSVEHDNQFADQLYLNQWQESKQLNFINGSLAFGLQDYGYGMGVTFGDIDNDGDLDLFLSNYGEDVMLRNNAGQFEVINGPWQTDQWSTSATFIDYNRDGWLDLYVGKYNQYKIDQNISCINNKSQIDYCSPKTYLQEFDSLYLNQQGTFIDVSESAGILAESGYTLGVVVEDFNADGWPDILTANDATKNLLWINQQNGNFVNEGLKRGIAVNGKGEMEASMGIGMTDLENDLDWDFIMTHLASESNTLYVNDGQGFFMDQSNVSRMVYWSKPYTAFGVGWLDVNNDSLEDLIVINGAVNTLPEQREAGIQLPLRQKQQILLQQADQRFEALVDDSFALLTDLMVGRSAVFADFDNDGDKEFIVTNNHGHAVFIDNLSPVNQWLGLELINRNGAQALGASAVVIFNDGSQQLNRFHNDGSYLSGNDPRITLRWSGEKQLKHIKISWPDGSESMLNQIKANQYQKVIQP